VSIGFSWEVRQGLLDEHRSLQVLQGNPQLPNPNALRKMTLLPVVAGDVIVCHGLGFFAHLAHGLTLLQHFKRLSELLGLHVCHAC
jgi:hypothetical protein